MMRHSRLALLSLVAPLAACTTPLKLSKDDSGTVLARQQLGAPSPATPGAYTVRTLTYGSGTDRRRAEYRDSIRIRTRTVDASPFVSAAPDVAKSRQKYWGFDFKKFPLNGRVWYPEGDGPFPLVLVVHGNHDMKDFSDPGYGYLGELLASRGYIVVSVDQNFINGNLRGENDGRGWLLLKHLEAWKAFNDSAGRPFHGKVDLGRIALMGHSRGGEAVAVAAAFNRLAHYPDDATVRFDFHFGIRALVAIAPVDGQYTPAGKPTPVENVNYLVIHGSHDGDVTTFSGLRQFQRIQFTDGRPWFKSAVYVYRANHGQWNTVWGNKDNGPRSARRLDLRPLITPEEQQQFGKVYLSAFLDATLRGDTTLLPLFRDHRVAGSWLPKTMYITRFQESGFTPLATFDEDVDVTTASVRGATLRGDSLSTWKEGVLPSRGRSGDLGTNAVWLGWNNTPVGTDTATPRAPASYTVTLTDSLRAALGIGRASSLVLSLAPTDAKPGARKTGAVRDSAAKPPAPKRAASGGKKPSTKPLPDTTPMDLSIELVDADGHAARLPLSRFGAVRRPLEITVLRRKGRDKQNFANLYELVLQTYVLPLADFAAADASFDPARLRAIRLVFDRTRVGTVVVDDIGVSTLNPAFFVNR